MKNKTLLIAAAALVAGVISSEAQVYSANVVGYANVVCSSGVQQLLATPLTTGNDVLTNVIVNPPGSTIVQVWNPVAGAFSTVLSYTGPANNRHWKDGGGNNQDNFLIPPGTAYFINVGGSTGFTNTYVGSVVAASGASVTNTLSAGTFSVGSAIPYGGAVTNAAGLNLVPSGSTILELWDPVGQAYNLYSYTGPANNRTWKDSNSNVVVPQIGVAQGFFILPGGTGFNWVQTLQ